MSSASTHRSRAINDVPFTRFSFVPCLLANALYIALPVQAADIIGPVHASNGASVQLGANDVVLASGNSKAVWVSGAGSTATINGSRLETLGGGGVYAEAGGQVTLHDVTLSAAGNALYASGAGSVIDATNVSIIPGAARIGTASMQAYNGGVIRYSGGDITLAAPTHIFSASGVGSAIHLNNTKFSIEKGGSWYAIRGGLLTVHDSYIPITPSSTLSGIYVADTGSRAEIYNTKMDGGWFDVGNAGSLLLVNVTANTVGGNIRVMGDRMQQLYGNVEIVGGTFNTVGGYGININIWGKVVARDAAFDVRYGYAGIWMAGESYLQLIDSSIDTWASSTGHGIENMGGFAIIQSSQIATHGDSVYGLRITGSSAGSISSVDANDTHIIVVGHGGGGVFLGGHTSSAKLDKLTISSQGEDSFGIVLMNTAKLNQATGLSIHMSGAGSGGYRSYLTELGDYWNRATFADSAIETASGPAFWLQGSNHSLTLNDSEVTAANGRGRLLRVSDTVLIDDRRVVTGRINFISDTSILRGDVAVDSPSAFVNMQLNGGTQFNGALLSDSGYQVSQLSLDDRSRWNVRANSSVGELNHAGTIAFDAPMAGDFKSVTVTGDYVGQGGHWLFNRALGDDSSLGDQLIIQGNSSGTATVSVRNAGGAGAQTRDGIRLISVGGQSDAAFTLQGRAVAGLYDYFLFKGGVSTSDDGNWYLRSEMILSEEPQPEPEPEPEPLPEPNQPKPQVERPEPAVYLANQRAARSMFQHSLYDRAGDPAARAGSDDDAVVWMDVRDNQLNNREDSKQIHLDGDASSVLLGIGRRFDTDTGGELQAGVMLGQGRASNRSHSQVTGYAARGEVEGRSVGLYGTWLQDAKMEGGVYVDGWLQYGRFHNSVRGDGLAEERYKSHSWTASAEAGYTLPLSRNEQRGVYVEPQLQVVYSQYDAERVVESNGTVVRDESDDAIATRLGVRLYSREMASGQHPVNPYVAVNWWSGGNKSAISVDGENLHRNAPRDMIETKAGVQVNLSSVWRGWGEISSQAADGVDFSGVGAQVGVSYSW